VGLVEVERFDPRSFGLADDVVEAELRQLAAAAVLWRIAATVVGSLTFLGRDDVRWWVWPMIVTVVLYNATVWNGLRRRPRMEVPHAALAVDLALAGMLNIVISTAIPPTTLFAQYNDPLWGLWSGTAALWTVRYSPLAGSIIAAASIPLQYAMAGTNGLPLADVGITDLLARTAWAVTGVVLVAWVMRRVRHAAEAVASTVGTSGRQVGITTGRQHASHERQQMQELLHTEVLGSLAMLAKRVEAARTTTGNDNTEVDKELRDVGALVKDISQRLRDRILAAQQELGPLEHELTLMLERLQGRHRETQFHLFVTATSWGTPNQHRALLTAARECLTNAVKHADPTDIWVTLHGSDDQLRLSVRDNGRGFAPDAVAFRGISHSIEQPILNVGGVADADSRVGRGCLWTITVPIEAGDGPHS
jgi:signal transduction histidine kinase